MTANLHAIWLDDLAPGEGATNPIWDALYAEQDAETQRVVFNACADEHTEPVAVPTSFIHVEGNVSEADAKAAQLAETEAMMLAPALAEVAQIKRANATKPKKKPTPRKPAAKKTTPRKKPGVLADAEVKLAGVAARVKAQTDELGGAS